MNLSELIRQPEGKTLEFKRDLSSPGPILRTVCALANTAGGTVVFGIADRSGTVLGIPDPLDAEERLSSIVADGITPRVLPDINIIPWRDTHVIALNVHPGPSRPYHLTNSPVDKGTYVRVGSTNRLADASLIAELARSAIGESYDEQPMPDYRLRDLDEREIDESFAGKRATSAARRKTLRLTVTYQDKEVPTIGGMLLFGRDRLAAFPDAWIQVGRFKGVSKRFVLDTADLLDYPTVAIEYTLTFIARNTSLAYELHGARRIEVPEYPPEAVREAVINAVVHADYSQRGAPVRVAIFDDRIEIENPGLLVPGLTIPDMLAGVSKVRNRMIARVFRELGLIEQWGSGVGRMHEACTAAGLAPPLLEEIGSRFRVTLYSARLGKPAVDMLDSTALEALRGAEGLSTAEVAALLGRTTRATRDRLRRLVERGLVVELGSSPNDPHRRYYIAEDPARWKT